MRACASYNVHRCPPIMKLTGKKKDLPSAMENPDLNFRIDAEKVATLEKKINKRRHKLCRVAQRKTTATERPESAKDQKRESRREKKKNRRKRRKCANGWEGGLSRNDLVLSGQAQRRPHRESSGLSCGVEHLHAGDRYMAIGACVRSVRGAFI